MTAPRETQNGIARIRWRERLTQGRAALKAAFFASPNPRKLLRDQAQLVDEVLTGLWLDCHVPNSLSLIAVGGYGRGELYPFSDVDILVLLPESTDAGIDRMVEQFVSLLWDSGLEVGHSVRT